MSPFRKVPNSQIQRSHLFMLQSLKRLTQHSAVYGIGHILTRGVGFLLLPLYTNFLDPDALGIAAIVFLYLAIMTILYTYGLDSAFLRYFILADEESEKIRLFSTGFLTVLLTSVLFSVLGYVFAHDLARVIVLSNVEKFLQNAPSGSQLQHYLSESAIYFQYAAAILFFDALTILPFLVLRAKERSKLFVTLKFLNVIVNLSLNIVFVAHWGYGLRGIFLANVISSAFTFVTLLPVILQHFRAVLQKDELKKLLVFGLPYLPSTLAVVLMDLIDRFILKAIKGYEVLGVYHANYKLAMIMSLFVAAFRFAWHPFFLSTSKQPDAKPIFAKVLTYFMFACAMVYLTISYFMQDIVRIRLGSIHLIGEEYWGGLSVVPIVMLAYVFYGAYLNFLVGIYLEKKTGYLPFITGLGLLVNIVGNVAMIPRYGMHGAAWATVFSYVAMAVALYGVSRRLYPVAYEFGRLVRIGAMMAAYMFILLGWTPGFWWRLALLLAFPIMLFLTGFFEKREIDTIRSYVARLFPGPA